MRRSTLYNVVLIAVLLAAFLLVSVKVSHCQTTSVTATLTDSDGQAWTNGTWTATLYNPSGTQQPVYTATGQPVPTFTQNQTLDATGTLIYNLPDNNLITPLGTRWTFTICSDTSAQCSAASTNLLITGSSMNLTTTLSAQLTVPRYPMQHAAHGYLDVEYLNPIKGSQYYNVTTKRTRIYDGTQWLDMSGPGTTTPGNPSGSLQMNNSGVFTGVTNSTVDASGNVVMSTLASNVNSIVYVKAPPYNAKCDGTTDDVVAIQAAVNAVTANNGTVQFPAGTCLTSTIVWKGQSLYGAGKGVTFIKGKPGQDVFQTPDNHSFNFPQGTTVGNLNIQVDATVDASSLGNNTFPNRIAGQQSGGAAWPIPIVPGNVLIGAGGCNHGANTTAGTSLVTLSCQGTTIGQLAYALGLIDSNLVIGQPITINGAGVSGGVYTGTIQAITAGTCTGGAACSITVNPVVSTTVTNATGNMLTAQTPPWHIGNAAFAIQCSNSTTGCPGNFASANFYNIQIDQTGTSLIDSNHCAGIFTQAPFYASHFEKVQINNLYGGYVEAAPPTGPVGTPDTWSAKDFDIFHSVIAMVTYNGNDRSISNLNLYAEYPLNAGLYQLGTNATWVINGFYSEGNWAQSGEIGRIGGSIRIHAANVFNGYYGTAWYEWLGIAGYVDGMIGYNLKVDGNMNNFRNANMSSTSITDNGYGNVFEDYTVAGNNSYWGRRYNPASIPPRDGLGTLDASFVVTGNASTPYLNANDFLTTCADWSFSYNPTATGTPGTCVPDPTGTEITRRYYQSPASNPTQAFDLRLGTTAPQNAWVGQARTVGVSNQNNNGGWSIAIPKTKMLISVNAQCLGATTCTARGYIKDIQANTNVLPLQAISFTNTWSTQSWVADFSTATTGDVVAPLIDSWAGTGFTGYQIAWIAMTPLRSDPTYISPLYSTAGTPLPTCGANNKGQVAMVSDATTPTYNGTYTGGSTVTVPVICNGTSWLTH